MKPKEEEALVRECFENFPEASISLSCTKWKYEKFEFVFVDQEDGKSYTVRLADAIRGLRLMIAAVERGELPGLGLPAEYLGDTGTWDGSAFDALAQFAIFGEVIYG